MLSVIYSYTMFLKRHVSIFTEKNPEKLSNDFYVYFKIGSPGTTNIAPLLLVK